MSEHNETQTQTPTGGGAFTDGLDRLWGEIKQISKQVERETRRSGRVARLHLDTRKLKKEIAEVQSRLGKAVYEARAAAGDDVPLSELAGYAGGIAALDSLHEQLRAKEAEIEEARGDEAAAQSAEKVVEEPAG